MILGFLFVTTAFSPPNTERSREGDSPSWLPRLVRSESPLFGIAIDVFVKFPHGGTGHTEIVIPPCDPFRSLPVECSHAKTLRPQVLWEFSSPFGS